jgi:hypothetical protein
MITEVIRSETSERLAQMLVEKYHRYENVTVSTNLGDGDVEETISKIKEMNEKDADDQILLVVKYMPPKENPYPKTTHPLIGTLRKLYDVEEFLQENSLGGTHLTNLPQHFWEILGEAIKDVEDHINPPDVWEKYYKDNQNVWGFKILNPKTF